MGCILRKGISFIFKSFPLLKFPYLINSYAMFKEGKGVCGNWGDDLNGHFLREIISGTTYPYSASSLAYYLHMKNYLVVGSTIDLIQSYNSVVWGAGIINENCKITLPPQKILAVRGPKTRECLLKQGIECPEIYGDPALLIPYQYKPSSVKRYKYGIIPHKINNGFVKELTLEKIPVNKRSDVLVIDMSKYESWTEIPDLICSCKAIISGSLHGLIVAEAYGIPNVWVEFGKPLVGGHFKFHDFFQSIHRDRSKPIIINHGELPMKTINDSIACWQKGNIDLRKLVEVSPFKLKMKYWR